MPTVRDFFKIGRGSSGLTEELIYNNSGNMPVISATSERFLVFGNIKEDIINKDDIITFPAILIIRVGKAGQTQIVDSPKYIITENVLILYPKEEFKDDFDLKWVEHKLRPMLLQNARGDKNGQMNISAEIIYRLKFEKKDIAYQKEYSKMALATENIHDQIKIEKEKLKKLMQYEIIN